jgi:hypothetical protein
VAASARPAPALAAPNQLVRPAGRTGALSGRVLIDPSYVVKQQAGKLIGNDGASVLAAGADSLITNDGGSLITNDGGSIVAQGGGNVVAPASLIAQDGGSIISNDGASAVAPRTRHLLEAGAGTPLAAAGMVVYARSLTTHQPIEIGRDKDDQPVYAVYTNLKGGYELYLPPAQVDNVEVVAFVPGKPDPRMRFQTVAPPTATEAPVGDDTSIIVNYVRAGYRTFARRLIATNNAEILDDAFVTAFPGGAAIVKGRIDELNQHVRAAGIDQLPESQLERVADRLTDIVIAHAGLDQARPRLDLLIADNPYPMPPGLTSLAVLRALLADQLPKVAATLARPDGPERFANAPLVRFASERDHRAYQFQRAMDYYDFLALGIINVHATIAPGLVAQEVETLEAQTGVPGRPGAANWLLVAYTGLMDNLGVTLMASEGATEQIYALFESLRKG